MLAGVSVLFLGAAFEELLPKVGGVGFPILLMSVQFLALCGRRISLMLFALAAGAMEDSLSGLVPMTSVCYFLGAAFVARWSGFPRTAMCLAYPCYQVWLAVWTAGMGGSAYTRILIAFPVGLMTAFAVGRALTTLFRKAAVDEQG